MDEKQRQQYLTTMGIERWIERKPGLAKASQETPKTVPETKVALPETAAIPPAAYNDVANLGWDALRDRVANCTLCGLEKTRTQTVFGVGNREADLLIVGEAPGANEDKLGEPFVGRAGHLLDAMLVAIGLKREQVFIANILKCRPPNNRDPNPHEVACCTPYLERQVALLKPKLILALGRIAAHYLLNTSASLGSLRGQDFHFGVMKTPLIITYHPAYLLRSPKDKRKAMLDLLRVKEKLNFL